jgi:RNA polymerase subunit RPABC4/transcription elongation factor Spt4
MPETSKRCINCGRLIPEDELICLSCGSENEMQTFSPRIITNADRIRAMTDEQIADAITADAFCGKVTGEIATVSDCGDRKCAECALQWLKKEADG